MTELSNNATTMPSVRTAPRRPRAFVLLLTLLLIALLMAGLSQLVFVSGTTAVVDGRHNADLTHRLAVESAIALAHQELGNKDTWVAQLDRAPEVRHAFDLSACHVELRIRDDGAKLPIAAFADPTRKGPNRLLEDKLRQLERRLRLPRLRIRLQPRLASEREQIRAYVWFDQLFERPEGHRILAVTDTERQGACWSDALTLFGDGRLDLRRAKPEVIDVALGDLVPGAGRRVPPVSNRQADNAQDLLRNVLANTTERTRNELLRRVTWDAGRYALNIRTSIRTDDTRESDIRRWYVVATLGGSGPQIHYRGKIEW